MFFAAQIIFRRGRGRAQKAGQQKCLGHFVAGAGFRILPTGKQTGRAGSPQTGKALSDWIERALAENTLADLRQPLAGIMQLHYRHRFDPTGLDAAKENCWRKKPGPPCKA